MGIKDDMERDISRGTRIISAKQFGKDFDAALAQINALAVQYGLPAPTIVFSPEWKPAIMQQLDPSSKVVLKHFGINFRFGAFRENMTTFGDF